MTPSKNISPIIETNRLILRPYVLDDLDDYFTLLSNKENLYYLQDIVTETMGDARASLIDAIQLAQEDKAQRFAITLKQNPNLIGGIGYDYIYDDEDKCTNYMGWFLMPEYHNQGIITESARAVLDFAREQDGITTMFTGCFAKNIPTQKVMEKLGFMLVDDTYYKMHDGEMKQRLKMVLPLTKSKKEQ